MKTLTIIILACFILISCDNKDCESIKTQLQSAQETNKILYEQNKVLNQQIKKLQDTICPECPKDSLFCFKWCVIDSFPINFYDVNDTLRLMAYIDVNRDTFIYKKENYTFRRWNIHYKDTIVTFSLQSFT